MNEAQVRIRRGYLDLPDEMGGGQIHYRRAGDLGGPTLILLHQSPSSSAMYESLMQALSGEFDMIALDTPAFGQSDALPGDLTIAAAAEVLAEAVSQVHIGPCFWFGHHTGAALALQIAHEQPARVSRLALSGPCLLTAEQKQSLPKNAAGVKADKDGSHLMQLWRRMQVKDVDAPLAIIERETTIGLLAGEAYPAAYAAVVDVDTEAQLSALQCPTLLFAGTEDPLYGRLDDAAKLVEQGRKAEIPGARTFVCERETAQVAKLLSDFFGEAHV